jgi:nucleoside-diphosphate-sugar epimerase
MDDSHTVITGASGLLGRELTRILSRSALLNQRYLHLVTSHKKKFQINGVSFFSKTFGSFHHKLNVENYYDFAFLTRDKIESLGVETYQEYNMKIIKESASLIERIKPKNVILASSGAVYNLGINNTVGNNYLYSDLKNLQEEEISRACSSSGSNLIISRIFNISGVENIQSKSFALTDFISKSIHNEDIQIQSKYLVYRRYCDVNQLLQLTAKLAEQGVSITFDSGGTKIEIRDLAKKIVNLFNSQSKIRDSNAFTDFPTDDYFSQSNQYEALLDKFLKTSSLSIEHQIMLTRRKILGFSN